MTTLRWTPRPYAPAATSSPIDLTQLRGEIAPPTFDYADWFCTMDRMTLLSAPPGLGKTYFLLHLGLAFAMGAPLLGHPYTGSRPLRVVYLDCEMGERSVLHRLKSIVRGSAIDPVTAFPYDNIHIFCEDAGLPRGFIMNSLPGVQRLRSIVDEYKPDIIMAEPLINLIGPTSDDRDNVQMNNFMRRIIHVAEGPRWFIAHHENKGGEYSPKGDRRSVSARIRGATALEAAADRVFSIVRRDKGVRMLEWGKCRHWVEPEPAYFRFEKNPVDEEDRQFIRLAQVRKEEIEEMES